MVSQGFRQILCVARKDPVARQAAVVEQPIGEVSDEPGGIAALDPQRSRHGGFDGLIPGDFKQHDSGFMGLRKRFDLAISRRQFDCEALLPQGELQTRGETRFIAGQEYQW